MRTVTFGAIPVPCGPDIEVLGSSELDLEAELAFVLTDVKQCMKRATAGDLPKEVTEDKSLEDDLNLDSLTMVEVAVLAEGELGVRVPDEVLTSLVTVGDVVGYIAGRSASLSGPATAHTAP